LFPSSPPAGKTGIQRRVSLWDILFVGKVPVQALFPLAKGGPRLTKYSLLPRYDLRLGTHACLSFHGLRACPLAAPRFPRSIHPSRCLSSSDSLLNAKPPHLLTTRACPSCTFSKFFFLFNDPQPFFLQQCASFLMTTGRSLTTLPPLSFGVL